MNEIMPFDYSGQQVRTVLIDGDPWFVAADVVDILGIGRVHDAVRGLDEDEKGTGTIRTPGGDQQVSVVNEPGLYALILRSRKPEAKAFRRWLTHTVLPEIRRTGQYGSQVPTSFAEALELAAVSQRAIEAAEAKIAADAPKVEAYEALMDAEGYYSMEAAAKILQIGRTTLFRRLRDLGIIRHGSRLPYQEYMHHFVVTATTWTSPDGETHPDYTPRVRPSGLEYLRKRLVGTQLEIAAGED